MTLSSNLFTFGTDAGQNPAPTPTPTPTPAPVATQPTETAPEPAATNTTVEAQLAEIREALGNITASAGATKEQKTQAKKLGIEFDPSKFENTDPLVVEELKTNLVDSLNAQLATIGEGINDPKLKEIDNKLNSLTQGLTKLTEQEAKKEAERQAASRQQAILKEVPDLPEIIGTESFREYMTKPIVEGSKITIGQVLQAAEANGEVDTIKGYVTQFRALNAGGGDHPPAAPRTQSTGASYGAGEVTSSDLSSLRAQLRAGASRAEVAARLKEML